MYNLTEIRAMYDEMSAISALTVDFATFLYGNFIQCYNDDADFIGYTRRGL